AAAFRDVALPMLAPRAPFALFYPAVVLASVLGGVPAGAGALVSSVAAALSMPPYSPLASADAGDWLVVALFSILSLFLIFAIDALRAARQAAEEANRRAAESERMLTETLRAARIGYWTWDFDSGRVTWSDNLEEIHGLPPGAFAGRFESFLNLVHPEDAPAVRAAIDRAVRERGDYDIEFRVPLPDGRVEWINGRGRARLEGDRVVGMTGLGMNITDRRAAGEARAHLAAIIDSSDDAIVSKDLSGRITSWNAAAERLFGYTASEIVGRSIETLLPKERADDFFSILSRIRRGERVEHYETLRKRKDGSTIELSLTVSPIVDASGRIVGASKIARDLTARREAEREQQRTRELLLGVLGHDLRNPLNTIAASLFYMEKRVPESLQHVVTRMTNSANRMVRLIEQLLDLTRARLGVGIPLALRPTDLRQIGLAAIDEFEAQHPRRIRLAPGGEIAGSWDPDRLGQVFSNLLGNALSHGSPVHPVDVVLAQEDGMVRIEVTNRGEPIPAAMRESIFEPFQRVGGGSAGTTPGLGLGLYITREIVRAHRGTIDLVSRPDGTTFSICLPSRPPESTGEGGVRGEP
ncbi:MAG TPA: PAS domain S-box protein, partial [Thermoanaerobaculia bacterium]